MSGLLVSDRWRRLLKVLAPVVMAVACFCVTRPAAAQKQVFDRKKPHVNVSGAAWAFPDTLWVNTELPQARTIGVGVIIVFQVLNEEAVESPEGDFVLVAEKVAETDEGEAIVIGEVWSLVDLSNEETTANLGYIRIKKLSSGG